MTPPDEALLGEVARAIRDARALLGTKPVARLSDVDRRAARAAIAIVVERCAEVVQQHKRTVPMALGLAADTQAARDDIVTAIRTLLPKENTDV